MNIQDSIFGPSTPVGKVRYCIANGVDNLFIPENSDDNEDDSGAILVDVKALIEIDLGSALDGAPLVL